MNDPLPQLNVPTGASKFNTPAGNGFTKWFDDVKQGVDVLAVEVLNRAQAAVAPAVDAALEQDNRVPAKGEEDSFRVRDKTGAVALEVTEDGETIFSGLEVRPFAGGLRFLDKQDRIALEISEFGRVFIGDPIFGVDPGTGSAKASRAVLVLGMGQSNMEGRARPFGAGLDIPDERIQMWDWSASAIVPARVPLSSQQQQTGLSVATVIAREVIDHEPAGTAVVILNAGVGNSPLVGVDSTIGTWRTDYAGPAPKLFENAMAAAQATVTAMGLKYGVTPEVHVFWHQGEADSTNSEYATQLDALIDAIRARLGSAVPFTLGGIVPEYITTNPTRANVRAAQIQTPARKTLTAYADGIPNGGGSASITDVVHYHRAGAEALGAAMYQASRRALANTTASVPLPPLKVTAELSNGQLLVTWAQPFCRATGYVAQYSTDGNTWTDFPARSTALETHASIARPGTTPVQVRVATVNTIGTSAPSAPTYMIGT